jgi:hypothetical protein
MHRRKHQPTIALLGEKRGNVCRVLRWKPGRKTKSDDDDEE